MFEFFTSLIRDTPVHKSVPYAHLDQSNKTLILTWKKILHYDCSLNILCLRKLEKWLLFCNNTYRNFTLLLTSLQPVRSDSWLVLLWRSLMKVFLNHPWLRIFWSTTTKKYKFTLQKPKVYSVLVTQCN